MQEVEVKITILSMNTNPRCISFLSNKFYFHFAKTFLKRSRTCSVSLFQDSPISLIKTTRCNVVIYILSAYLYIIELKVRESGHALSSR